jgi:hypothetical protein
MVFPAARHPVEEVRIVSALRVLLAVARPAGSQKLGSVVAFHALSAERVRVTRTRRFNLYTCPHANNLTCIEAPVLTFVLTTLLYSYFACRLKFAGVDSHQRGSDVRRTE